MTEPLICPTCHVIYYYSERGRTEAQTFLRFEDRRFKYSISPFLNKPSVLCESCRLTSQPDFLSPVLWPLHSRPFEYALGIRRALFIAVPSALLCILIRFLLPEYSREIFLVLTTVWLCLGLFFIPHAARSRSVPAPAYYEGCRQFGKGIALVVLSTVSLIIIGLSNLIWYKHH